MSPRVSNSWLNTSTDSNLDTTIQAIITGLSGNVAFPNLAAALAAVVTLLGAFTAALGIARDGSTADTAAKNAARASLVVGVRTLGRAIDSTAQNLEQALSTKYPLQKERSALGIQPAPSNVRAKHGKVSGSVACTSDGSDHRVMYDWQSAVGENPGTWITEPSTNSASATFSGHVPGSWLNVRVRIRVPAGAGDWSGVAKIMVV